MNKKFIYRINNESGYAIGNILILLMIFSILAIFISTQISRQIKSTTKRTNEIQLQYTSEAGIDRAIEEILIEINKLRSTQSYTTKLNSTDLDYIYLIQQQVNDLSEINGVDNSNLNRAKNNINYNDTIESIILKLNDVRTELLKIVEDNPSKRIEIKDDIDNNIGKICIAIDYANVEKNKNISAIELDTSTPRGFINYCEDLTHIIGREGGKDKYGNTFKDIVSYMADAAKKVKNINEVDGNLNETLKLEPLVDNLHSMGNNDLHQKKLNPYAQIFNIWNPNEEAKLERLEQAENDLAEIELMINECISDIRSIRKEIYLAYTYCMASYNLNAENEFKQYTDEALKMYDSIEDQLMWFKKKIGISSSSNDNESGNNGNGGTTIINPEDITLSKYYDEFDVMNSNYRYEVKYEGKDGQLIDEIILPIKSENLKTINIKLVSIATSGNNSYKTRANIQIDIDGTIKYTINSYERIN